MAGRPDQKRRGSGGGGRKGQSKVKGVGAIRKKELGPFTDKLAAMLDAGLPLIQCLDALCQQAELPEWRRILTDLKNRVEGGEDFSDALSHYESVFGELYVSMIRAGEMGGGLPEVTARLSEYISSSAALVRRVKGAMAYPVIVLFLALILTVVMLVFIVPVFAGIFSDFGGQLPGPTQMLMNISDVLREQAPLVILVFGAAIFAFKKWKATPKGALTFAKYIRKAPVAGDLIEKIALARMSRTFASLYRSGVPILNTIDIVATATGNKYIGEQLRACGTDIESGENISVALKKRGEFPTMVLHMISAGEQTGNIDGMLEKVADFYDDEVTTSLEALSSMIEPLLMAFIGVTVGGIVICMFLPIFKMHEVVGG